MTYVSSGGATDSWVVLCDRATIEGDLDGDDAEFEIQGDDLHHALHLRVDIDVLKRFVEVANRLIREWDTAPEPTEPTEAADEG